MSANTTKLLADPGSTPPSSLIPADEGSMVSMSHLSGAGRSRGRNGCKLVLADDQEQLSYAWHARRPICE